MLEHKDTLGEELEKDAHSLTLGLPGNNYYCSFSDADLRLMGTPRSTMKRGKKTYGKDHHRPSGVKKPRVRVPFEYDVALLIAELKGHRLDGPQTPTFSLSNESMRDKLDHLDRVDRYTAGLRPGTPMPNRRDHR